MKFFHIEGLTHLLTFILEDDNFLTNLERLCLQVHCLKINTAIWPALQPFEQWDTKTNKRTCVLLHNKNNMKETDATLT